MNNEFIPYAQALELRELGFNEECIIKYSLHRYEGTLYEITNGCRNMQLYTDSCTAPFYQQAFRFFREKYKLASYIQSDELAFELGYIYSYKIPKLDIINDEYEDTYEEAELACLKKLIEIVKTK